MLVSEGLLVSRRGGGTFVRWQHEAWSEQNIVQPLKRCSPTTPITVLIFWKRATPSKPARHGMRRCAQLTPKERIRLCFEATQSEDPDLASQADVRFHGDCRSLAQCGSATNHARLFDLLQSSVKQSRQRMYLVPPVFARLTEQHQAVMEAIFAGDAEGARGDDGALRLCPRHD